MRSVRRSLGTPGDLGWPSPYWFLSSVIIFIKLGWVSFSAWQSSGDLGTVTPGRMLLGLRV